MLRLTTDSNYATTSSTSKLKLLKKPLFHKRRWSCDSPPRKMLVTQKQCAISRQEKMAFSFPRRVALRLPSSSPRVCTYRRTLRLELKFLGSIGYHSAPLCSLRPQRSSAIKGTYKDKLNLLSNF